MVWLSILLTLRLPMVRCHCTSSAGVNSAWLAGFSVGWGSWTWVFWLVAEPLGCFGVLTFGLDLFCGCLAISVQISKEAIIDISRPTNDAY